MHLRVSLQKVSNPLGVVCREVIGNHMNLFAYGLIGHEVRQKGDELDFLQNLRLRISFPPWMCFHAFSVREERHGDSGM